MFALQKSPIPVLLWLSFLAGAGGISVESFAEDASPSPSMNQLLPETLNIHLGKTVIKGRRGYPETPSPELQADQPEEGFLYHARGDDPDKFEVVAWSSQHRESEILAAAEEKLTQMLNRAPSEEKPAGFAYSDKAQKERGSHPGGRVPTDSGVPKVSLAPPLSVSPAETPKVPETSVSPPPILAAAECGNSCLLPWILFLITLILLVLSWVRPRRA